MRRWGIASGLFLLLTASASAQPADVAATSGVDEASFVSLQLGYGALPGGFHAPAAMTLPKGMFTVATVGGFGWRSGLLETTDITDHRFGRGIGNFALAYGPHELFTIALALDGRYDRHFGVPKGADGKVEDGYVGDPRLIVRAGKPMGNLTIGGQVGVWVPGKDAPSVEASAISVDARGLLSLAAGPGTLSVNAGFRLDNSAKSAAESDMYSLADRISLGVSNYHAVVGGAHFTMPQGKAFFGGEASIDLFLGSADGIDAPGPILRGGVHGGIHLTSQWSLLAFVELAKVPAVDADDANMGKVALIPYEPMVTGGIGVQGRFGGPKGGGNVISDIKDLELPIQADLTITVVDETGKPVVGAPVKVELTKSTGNDATSSTGAVTVKLPIGTSIKKGKTGELTKNVDDATGKITVTVDNKKPFSQPITLVEGANPPIKITLEPLLPPGQLRALVRAAGTGRPIANATVTIEPGGISATSAADGTLQVDIPPGTYKATATAPGVQPQTLEVTIEQNGVTTKNFELR